MSIIKASGITDNLLILGASPMPIFSLGYGDSTLPDTLPEIEADRTAVPSLVPAASPHNPLISAPIMAKCP